LQNLKHLFYIFGISLSILLCQSGISILLSYQSLLLIITLIAFRQRIKISRFFSFSILICSLLFAIKIIFFPYVFTGGRGNPISVGLFQLFGLIILINLSGQQWENDYRILKILKSVSILVILILFILLILSELGLFALSREFFLYQNASLLFNYTDEFDLINFAEVTDVNTESKIDLLYGEPSFLAYVVFNMLLICLNLKYFYNKYIFYVVCFFGLAIFFALKGLSGIIYMTYILTYLMKYFHRWFKYVLVILVFTLLYNTMLESILPRFSLDNVSFIQRITPLFDLDFYKLCFGFYKHDHLPLFGIHNGILHLISIGGLILFIFYVVIFVRFIVINKISNYSLIFASVFSALFQSGDIFSLTKISLQLLVMFSALLASKKLDIHYVAQS
jgi:hypothetical protein